MTVPSDACPRCDPGVPPAALPQDVSGSRAVYRCQICGHRWITRWDAFGWPIARAAA